MSFPRPPRCVSRECKLTCCFWVSTTSWTADCLAGLVTTIICRQALRTCSGRSRSSPCTRGACLTPTSVIRAYIGANSSERRILMERAMNIHRKFLSSKCGPALLVGRLSNKKGLLVDDDQLLYH